VCKCARILSWELSRAECWNFVARRHMLKVFALIPFFWYIFMLSNRTLWKVFKLISLFLIYLYVDRWNLTEGILISLISYISSWNTLVHLQFFICLEYLHFISMVRLLKITHIFRQFLSCYKPGSVADCHKSDYVAGCYRSDYVTDLNTWEPCTCIDYKWL